METQEKTLNTYAQELEVEMWAEYIETPEGATEWQKGADSYLLTFTRGDVEEQFNYYQGKGFPDEPTLERGLECLISDYRTLESCPTLKEFGREFGWSEETLDTYEALQENARKMKELFSDKELTDLMRIVEEANA